MKKQSNLSKKTLVIFIVFLFPIGSINFNNQQFNLDVEKEKLNLNTNQFERFEDSDDFLLDKTCIINDNFTILNDEDNDDGGYKRDAGDQLGGSLPIYPGEMVDNWPGRGRTGKVDSSDKEDWYKFSVCNGQVIEISLIPEIESNLDICLWDNNEIIRETSTNPGSSPESITFTADDTGTWFIQILHISGNGQVRYSFDVFLSGQNDANTGSDAGDSFNSATILDFGNYEGYLSMNDEEDWYKFDVKKDDNIHFILLVKNYALLSDFDISLYRPDGSFVHSENYYYDDEIFYSVNESGFWRVRIKIFPGYSDVPQSDDWDYFSYGSGAYKLFFNLVSSIPELPDKIPQPQITPIAQTFIIENDADSNKDEYSYLASIPACNYIDNNTRFVSPIVYSGDTKPTNWFGTVDDTTNYLLDDWNNYLYSHGKTAVQYNVLDDPISASAEIATNNWDSTNLAVVAIDGSNFEDTTSIILDETQTIKRKTELHIVPNTSNKIKKIGDSYFFPLLLGKKWGAINVSIYGPDIPGEGMFHIFPSLIQLYPKFINLASDWWPKYMNTPRYDIYYPVTTPGIWAAAVPAPLGEWDFRVTKYECHRYKIPVDDKDSTINVTLRTSQPSDLLLFIIDPQGHIRAPDMPYWNGGSIKPIHEWHGFDDGDNSTSCNPWRKWDPELHTEFSTEVLHPEEGIWEIIVVPKNSEGSSNIEYTIKGSLKEINQNRINAEISASNAAVIASQEHVPLLFVNDDSVPIEIKNVLISLGINDVIFVENNEIGNNVRDKLPNIVADLKSSQEIIDFIKQYPSSENYVTITSHKSGDGFFAPTAMLAAYHGAPVLRLDETTGKKEIINKNLPIQNKISSPNIPGWANRIDTWRSWGGDYYHGSLAPGHLPVHDEYILDYGNFKLLIELFKFLISGGNRGDLPPLGMDANRYWNEEMANDFYEWINNYGLDKNGKEAYVFVSPRNDIRIELSSVLMGNNSYSGHIPGETPAYTSDIIIRNIMYPALIFSNPNRDITTTQLMNFPYGDTWVTNNGVHHKVESTHIIKHIFMSHKRTFEGHCLWEAHLERINKGASIMYYSGHGTGGSGISAQYIKTENCSFPEQIWPNSWRGYMYDNWETARDNGLRWYNPKFPNLYDFIHYKWVDKFLENLRSNAIFYLSCSTGQHMGPLVYLDHGAVIWFGNAGSGSVIQEDLKIEFFFKDAMINGKCIGEAYSKYIWLFHRDFTTGNEMSMYGPSSIRDISTIHCIYGDPKLILYSPEWSSPKPIDSIINI